MTAVRVSDDRGVLVGHSWLRRQCRWETIGAVYQRRTGPIECGGARGALASRIVALMESAQYGFTTVTLRCVMCGDVRTKVVAGEYADPAAVRSKPRVPPSTPSGVTPSQHVGGGT